MKNYLFLSLLLLAGISLSLINGCKKDVVSLPPGKTSFTEEFVNFNTILQKGWIAVDNYQGNAVIPSAWGQGFSGGGKGGPWSGFTAYSYTSTPNEFAYSVTSGYYSNYSLNSWLITPVLSVRNGDKISFYTRGDTAGIFTDRMQVLMNPSTTIFTGINMESAGDFTKTLFDINADQLEGGYPTTWTKYEYTFSGFPEKKDIRIAFRHYVVNINNAAGVGIDLFRFQSQ